jgi:hypothetical protein
MRVNLWLIAFSTGLLLSTLYFGIDSLWKQIILVISATLLLTQGLKVIEFLIERRSLEKKHLMIEKFNQYGLNLFSIILILSINWFIPISLIKSLSLVKQVIFYGSLLMTFVFALRSLYDLFLEKFNSPNSK